MDRFPSGLGSELPEQVEDRRAWPARVLVAVDEHPIGQSAPCQNPECGRPVDYTGYGPASMYCSGTCRSRAATMRRNAQQQLDVIERLLAATKHQAGVPRENLRTRAGMLRWWLARLATREERR